VGDKGAIIHTVDGGNNWNAQTSGTPSALYGVVFADTNTGWSVGYGGTIVHTTSHGHACQTCDR